MNTKNLSVFVALAVIVAAVGGAAIMTQSAAATANGQTNANTVELTAESSTGQVSSLVVGSSGSVEWENMPDGVEYIEVSLATTSGENDAFQTFASQKFNLYGAGSSGSYAYSNVEGDVIGDSGFPEGTFSADEDGETQERYFPVKVTVTVVGPNGVTCEFTEKHHVETSVTNTADPSADGDTNVDGDIVMEDDGTDRCRSC